MSWNELRVTTARRRYSIAGQKRGQRDPEILTRNEAARYCGVSTGTIKRLVQAGLRKSEQVAPWAPWEIRRADLDCKPVRQVLTRLRETGRLDLGQDDSSLQLSFFEE